MTHHQPTISDSDEELLRRYEPLLRFSRGEQFFPMDAEDYIRAAQLCILRPNDLPEVIVPRGQLTGEKLGTIDLNEPGAISYMHFVDPLAPAELQRFRRESSLREFHAGRSRLARVGMLTRLGDVLFSISLLLRGKVPGGQAAAAAQRYHELLARNQRYCYYGRVLRDHEYLVLQYWLFYAYNDWRSSFHGVNDHEGDWEMISIFLAPEQGKLRPLWLGYMAHHFQGDDIRRSWDDPDLEKVGEHPVVYVAAGSHASYFLRGEYMPSVAIPLPSGVVRIWRALLHFWRETLRQGDTPTGGERADILSIPFVDYARGDGIQIGPGGAYSWEPFFLQNTKEQLAPPWLEHYRGLWGLYTGDQLAGEDAPGGPRYTSAGTVRMAWNDPIGWCGLDVVPAPDHALETLARRVEQLHVERAEVLAKIDSLSQRVGGMQLELQALGGIATARQRLTEVQRTLTLAAAELRSLKAQRAAIDLSLEQSAEYGRRLSAGERPDPRSHLRLPQMPASSADIRLSRAAEAWSAVSIGALLIGIVVLTELRGFWVPGVGLLLGVFAFLEALFHRRAADFMRSFVVILAVIASLVLIANNLHTVLIVSASIVGMLIIIDNMREL